MRLFNLAIKIPLIGLILFAGCNAERSNHQAKEKDKIEATLKDTTGWTVDTLANDLIWHRYFSFSKEQNAHQSVNVIEFDPTSEDKRAIIGFAKEKDSLSAVANTYPDIVAGINGTFFLQFDTVSYNYIKINGEVISTVDVAPGNKYYWKHEGILSFNNDGTGLDISYSQGKLAKNSFDNVITGAPVLIENFEPVGASFVKETGVPLDSLDYEHPARHQGVRHPRTAVAITGNGHLLLIAVDGRNEKAAGMNAKELTLFLQKYFNPKAAMNIDGGGSTTMWIKGQPYNGVVNRPTDNKKFDHYGQREDESFILIQEKSGH